MSERDSSFSFEIPVGPLTPEQQREFEQGNPWVMFENITLDSGESITLDVDEDEEGER